MVQYHVHDLCLGSFLVYPLLKFVKIRKVFRRNRNAPSEKISAHCGYILVWKPFVVHYHVHDLCLCSYSYHISPLLKFGRIKKVLHLPKIRKLEVVVNCHLCICL